MSKPPMIGTWQALVHDVRPYSIHGDLYYELRVTALDEDPNTPQGYALRVPQHAIAQAPQAGDRLSLNFLMGQVISAQHLS
jgi:hypothetical protein